MNKTLSGWYREVDGIDSIYLQNHPINRGCSLPDKYWISFPIECDIPGCPCEGKDLLPTLLLVESEDTILEYDDYENYQDNKERSTDNNRPFNWGK